MTEPAFQRDMRIGDRVTVRETGEQGEVVGYERLDGYRVLLASGEKPVFERRELERAQ